MDKLDLKIDLSSCYWRRKIPEMNPVLPSSGMVFVSMPMNRDIEMKKKLQSDTLFLLLCKHFSRSGSE